jgi:proteasome lid subunit RPN8/RPN11
VGPAAVRRAVIAHARRDRPYECCGLLLGRPGTIAFAVAVQNIERTTTRFHLDPRTHLEWQRRVRDLRPALAVIGVYHSHPSGAAAPSPSDIAEAHYPDWLHLIAGVKGRAITVKAFRITRGRALPVRVRWADT